VLRLSCRIIAFCHVRIVTDKQPTRQARHGLA
jgi:hypothetical protein